MVCVPSNIANIDPVICYIFGDRKIVYLKGFLKITLSCFLVYKGNNAIAKARYTG